MYNRVIMLGRITQDLELKTTPNGVPVLSFSIAVDRRFQTKGAEKKADFFNCVAWRNEAEFISRFWTKGRPILVEGELQNRSYVDKNNVTRYITEIIVDRASFTGDKRPEGAGGGSYSPQQGFPEPPPSYGDSDYSQQSSGYSQQHPASGTKSAPSVSNGSYTADDFARKDNAGNKDGGDDDYPF